ncbi:hypothetical protein EI534_14600 [Pseudomonas frederiksbergensis]|nr:hypothetical protein [Pseudomonas frederiksbergensis]
MEKIYLEAVQRGVLLDIDDIQPLEDADYAALKEIGDVLRLHKFTDRFGVCLLHKHFDLNEGEELIEETDIAKRVSITRAQKISVLDERTIETMWRFPESMQAGTKCVQTCVYLNGHSKIHRMLEF